MIKKKFKKYKIFRPIRIGRILHRNVARFYAASKKLKYFYKLITRIIPKFCAWVALVIFIPVLYFLILISVEYKSFPFITSEIEHRINQNMSDGNRINVGKVYLKFVKLHTIVVKFDDVRLINSISESEGVFLQKESILPILEAELSIFDLILLKTIPYRLKIINPTIVVDNTGKMPHIDFGDGGNDVLRQAYFQEISKLFLMLKDGNVAIKKFLILNAKIIVKNQQNKTQIITIKDSKVSTSFNKEHLNIDSNNVINIDHSEVDLFTNSNCVFSKINGLKCNVNFNNFDPASLSSFHPKLLPLADISGLIDGNFQIEVGDNHKLRSASFAAKSASGSFYYPQFFSKRINFNNLEIEGDLNNALQTLNISKLSTKFGDTKFDMRLAMTNLMDLSRQQTELKFKISDAPINNLDVLWPVFLNQNGVRKWVINNIKNGNIKDAYANVTLRYKDGVENLESVVSEIIFAGLSLEYSPDFPPISNAEGIASFSKEKMNINIVKANVLNSEVRYANVKIPNFFDSKVMLNISGNTEGEAADLLKHINYKSEFSKQIRNYFNGTAKSILNIKLPIIDDLELEDVDMKIATKIINFNNNYIDQDSSLEISVDKKIGNNDFVSQINLTDANVNLGKFNITKEKGVSSIINTTLSFTNDNNLNINNFKWEQPEQSIVANLSLEIDPFKITKIELQNRNFANSNFNLKYKVTNDSLSLKMFGNVLDLRNLFKFKSHSNKSNLNELNLYKKNDIEIRFAKIYLANNNKFENVGVDLNCNVDVCKNGFIKANLGNQKYLNIKVGNLKDGDFEGLIGDISVVAKAFDLSNQIVGGSALIKAKIVDSDKIKGELRIDSSFSVLKNEVVEKIYSNNAFSKMRDKIINKNEIKFDNLKLEFVLEDSGIDIQTLIANSDFMGFTSKGRIDFAKNETNLKGLIVPGYAINKLFNIGKIPILGKIIVGEEGGGIFAIRYDYKKAANDNEGNFSINPASALIPGGIRNVFDLF